MVLEKTLESPLDCKEIQPVHSEGDQPGISLEGMMLKLKFQYFGHLMRRVDSLEKTLMLGSLLVAQRLKRLPAMQETWVRSLGQEDPLEKEMAIYSSTLVWKIPWTEKPSRPQSVGSERVGHDQATSLHFHFS